MDKQVAISYLASLPHPRHVVYTGGYSDLRIPIHGPYYSTSYVIWDPTHDDLPLGWARYPSYHQDYHIRDIIVAEPTNL